MKNNFLILFNILIMSCTPSTKIDTKKPQSHNHDTPVVLVKKHQEKLNTPEYKENCKIIDQDKQECGTNVMKPSIPKSILITANGNIISLIAPVLTTQEQQGLKKALEQLSQIDVSKMDKYIFKIIYTKETMIRELYLSTKDTSYVLVSITVDNNSHSIKRSYSESGQLHKYTSKKFVIKDKGNKQLDLQNSYDKVYYFLASKYYKFERDSKSWKLINIGPRSYYLINDMQSNKYIKAINITYEQTQNGILIFKLYHGHLDDENPNFRYFIKVN